MAEKVFSGTPVFVVNPATQLGTPVRFVDPAVELGAPVYTVDPMTRIGIPIYESANAPALQLYYVDETTGAPIAAVSGSIPEFTNLRTNTTGTRILMDIVSGTWTDAGGIIVDPSKVTVTASVASVDASGVTNTATVTRAPGLRAEYVAGSPNRVELWLEEIAYADHSSILVSMSAGALTAGAQQNSAGSNAPVTNNNVLISTPLPTGHIIGAVEGRTVNKVQHAVMRNQWRPEASGNHESGLAGVEWTIVKTGGGTTVFWQGEERRSWYQDSYILDDAMWTANGGSGEAGLGVWPGPVCDPATDPTGPMTVTALFVPKAGGRARARTRTWQLNSAQAGAYPKKEVWLDTVGGSDANSGLTALLPKLTMAAACNTAGAASQGATAQTEPVVYIVGGTSGSPRNVEFAPPSTGTITNIPGQTDTWLTLMPAPGYAKDTIRIVTWASAGATPINRIRRTRFQDLIFDSSDSITGTSSYALSVGQTSVYDPATNPQAFWFDGCSLTHRQGKAGQLTEHTSGSIIANLFRENPGYWTNWDHQNTNQRGIQSSTSTFLRNVKIAGFGKDALKSVDHVFGFYIEDNAVDPIQLPINSHAVGTPPLPGDVITGVFSWPASETVASYVSSTTTAGTVILTPGGNSFSFKADDSKTHVAVTISTETGGTVVVGDELRNSGDTVRFKVYRRDGAILRGEYTTGGSFTTGITLTRVGGANTCVVNGAPLTAQKNLFFAGSGALATAAPPHPDGMQIQSFVPKVLIVSGIVGIFQVGENVTVPGVPGTITISAISGNQISVTANNSLFEIRSSNVVTGVTSGATATIDMVLANPVTGDRNVLVANGVFRRTDGQILFGENGSYGCAVWNVLGVHINASAQVNSHFDDVSGLVLAHSTIVNQDYVMAIPGGVIRPGQPQSQHIVYNIFQSNSSGYVAPGLPSTDDKGQPGRRNLNHTITPTGSLAFGARYPDAYNSNGDPVFVNGTAWDEDDTAATITKDDFRPTAAVPAGTGVPLAKRLARFDIRGVERVDNDWPGAWAKTA